MTSKKYPDELYYKHLLFIKRLLKKTPQVKRKTCNGIFMYKYFVWGLSGYAVLKTGIIIKLS